MIGEPRLALLDSPTFPAVYLTFLHDNPQIKTVRDHIIQWTEIKIIQELLVLNNALWNFGFKELLENRSVVSQLESVQSRYSWQNNA